MLKGAVLERLQSAVKQASVIQNIRLAATDCVHIAPSCQHGCLSGCLASGCLAAPGCGMTNRMMAVYRGCGWQCVEL